MTRFRTAKQIGDEMGLSVKALRLYEQRGLILPGRTTSGWRVYGPTEIAQLHKIQTLKLIGFSLTEIGKLLINDIDVGELLDVQETTLMRQQANVEHALTVIRKARKRLAVRESLSTDDLIQLTQETKAMSEFEWTEAHQKLAERHYTKDQLEQITNHKLSPEFQTEIDELWDGILADIERLKDGAADSPEALDVAQRWLDASAQFHRNDPDLIEASQGWYEDGYSDPDTISGMPFPKDVWEFAQAAIAALNKGERKA